MNMKLCRPDGKLFISCLAAGALSVIALHSAEVKADDFSKRFYLNGGVGVTKLEPESSTSALIVSDDSDVGFHIGLGVDLSRFISLEAYVADLGSAEIEFLGANVGSIDYRVFGLSALGYVYNSRSGFVFGDEDTSGLFRREGASVYGRFGVGHLDNDTDRVSFRREHPNHFAFGIGVEYGFSNGFALRTELLSIDTDAQYLNVGLVKRFGRVAAPAAAAIVAVPAIISDKPDETEVVAPPVVATPFVSPLIFFDFDLAVLTPESTQKLDGLVAQVKDKDSMLHVGGHTDWLAPEAYNISLSVRRAEAVANYLESQGISRERLTTVGYGEVRPVSDNDTEEGRAKNRRTEIQVR